VACRLGLVPFVLNARGIPVGIVSAKLLSVIAAGVFYEQAQARTIHRCRIGLFRMLLSSPLDMLYASGHGELTETFSNDFNTLTGRTLSLFPNLLSSMCTIAAYTVYLALLDPLLTLCFSVLCLLHVIAPFIEQKYMIVNYENSLVIVRT
jgi:ABC-type multidrug transport system fused ATPase/permease subunit